MVIELLKHWQVAVDGLQIFLCVLIIFFLIRNRRHKLKPKLSGPASKSAQDFNFEIFSQTISQQVDLAFANILQVATRERRNLDKVLQNHQLQHANRSSAGILASSPPQRRDEFLQNNSKNNASKPPQTDIQRLAARGMNAKQISDELKTPMAAVELTLSLQKEVSH